ncbi:26S proteasome regulatory subunit [Gurleya vavrai]
MFKQKEAEKLFKEKLWYDLCLYLQKSITKNADDSSIFFIKNIIPSISKIHPKTFTETSLSISQMLAPMKSQDLILQSYNALKSIEYQNEDHKKGLFLLEIKINENKIFLNEIQGIESFIYEKKDSKMDDNDFFYFYKMVYFYYEKCNNYEEMFFFLERFTKYYKTSVSMYVDNENLIAYKLVKSSLLSKDVYNFTNVSINRFYTKLQDEKMKNLFERVKSGDYKFINENKKEVDDLLENFNFIIEKVYLVAFVNLCFYCNEKEIKIEEIGKVLELDRKSVFRILLKAFGKKLVKGEIDGEKNVVKIWYVVPRVLSEEDLYEVKSKYENWKLKISEVIKMLN